ncbi:MAG: protoporphyrinogen oxidase [Acidobacteriota bacterium]
MAARDSSPRRVAVIGGGISGLTAAFRLSRAGAAVTVIEAASRCGGPMGTVVKGGHLFELGPTTVPSSAERLGRLIDDLGIRSEAVLSRDVAGRRLVWRRGRLHALPEKPPQLLTCTAISPLARLRLLMEPLIPARRGGEPETLQEFGRRRLGRGAVAGFLDPFITGVYAGRLDRLGVDAVPRLAIFEREYGSLAKARIAAQKARRAAETGARKGPPPLVSFPGGLGTLPRRLTEALAGDVVTGRRVSALERTASGWRVVCASGDGPAAFEVEAAVLAVPADVAARLLGTELGQEERDFLSTLDHPFVATVGLGYRRDQIAHDLNAFGVLIASDSRLDPEADVLGVLFPSSIFDGRAPEGGVTLTVMVGGSRDPRARELDDTSLVARATAAVSELLGAQGAPVAHHVERWPRAIPQYAPGHGARVRALRLGVAALGGVALAGNYLDGIGVEGAVTSGDAAARAIFGEETHG